MSSKTLTGDFDELKMLAIELEALSKSMPILAPEACRDLEIKAKSQFRAAKGPDDKPWKPRKDGEKAIQSLIDEVYFTPSPNGIRQHIPKIAEYHQDTRPMIPTGQELPLPWKQVLEKSYEKSIEKILKKVK